MALQLQTKYTYTNDCNDCNDCNHFNSLSNEIIYNILDLLEPYDILKLSQTNKMFRHFITYVENLLLLYKIFKKKYIFWNLFPNIDIALETNINSFDIKTFIILSKFQNDIKHFIKKKNLLTKNVYDKGIQMGFSNNQVTTLFDTFCDKQILNYFKLKYNGIDYTLNYENCYLTDLQIELAIKLKQNNFEADHHMYHNTNLTKQKVDVAIKLDKHNLTHFIIYCPDVFTDDIIMKINKLSEANFDTCCIMNIVNPIRLTTEEQIENLIKLKNCHLNLYDYDEENINTYILSYYAQKFTSAQIDNVIKYSHIDTILEFIELLSENQLVNFDKLQAELSYDLLLYIIKYFTDSQIESIIRLITDIPNINHNWCTYYVENLNLEQLENVIKLLTYNKSIINMSDIFIKYKIIYEIVKCYTTEHISYFLNMVDKN